MNFTKITARGISHIFQFLNNKNISLPSQSLHSQPTLPVLVSSICSLLNNGGKWESLSSNFSSAELTDTLVEKVILNLKEPEDAKNALLFFHWSSQYKQHRHSLKSYCIVVHILVRANLLIDAQALLESAITKNLDPGFSKTLVSDTLLSTYEAVVPDPRVFDVLVQTCLKMRFLDQAFDDCCYFGNHGIILSLLEKRVYPNQISVETMVNLMCNIRDFELRQG